MIIQILGAPESLGTNYATWSVPGVFDFVCHQLRGLVTVCIFVAGLAAVFEQVPLIGVAHELSECYWL